MTTATREPLNLPGPCPGAERMVWPVQTHPAESTGPESKGNSGDGGYFSLDFSFYRTTLPSTCPETPPSNVRCADKPSGSLSNSVIRRCMGRSDTMPKIAPNEPTTAYRALLHHCQ